MLSSTHSRSGAPEAQTTSVTRRQASPCSSTCSRSATSSRHDPPYQASARRSQLARRRRGCARRTKPAADRLGDVGACPRQQSDHDIRPLRAIARPALHTRARVRRRRPPDTGHAMRLIRLGANKRTFHTIEFQDGFNLIVAERTKESTKKDSRNGLGKSTAVDILNYCLGKGGRGQVPAVDDLAGWAFTLEAEILGAIVILT